MINHQIIKNYTTFAVSFLFLFSPIISLIKGSLFDYTFLLISILIWIITVFNRKNFSKVEFLILIYFLISTVQLLSLVFVEVNLFISALPIYLRINATLIFFDLILFRILKNKFIKNINMNYLLLYPFISITLLFSIWGITNSLLGLSWKMGFPLYSNAFGQTGVDPHVFGPAMACSFIGLSYIFFNLNDYQDRKNILFIRSIIFIDIISCISATLFCGSRGGLLILMSFLITYIPSVLLRHKNITLSFPIRVKKSKLLVPSLFLTFFITALNFISSSSGTLNKLILRTFSFLPVLYGTDPSRPSQLKEINEVLSNSFNYLFSRDNIWANADIGPKFFIYNQGLILFLLFICIYIYIYILLQKLNNFSASTFFAGLILLVFGSATLLIPRFYVIYFYALTLIATQKKFKHIPK